MTLRARRRRFTWRCLLNPSKGWEDVAHATPGQQDFSTTRALCGTSPEQSGAWAWSGRERARHATRCPACDAVLRDKVLFAEALLARR